MSVHRTCLTIPFGYRLIASHRLTAVPSFQPCVRTRGSPPESMRTSSARQIRSAPKRVNQAATSSGRSTAALPITTLSTPWRSRSSITAAAHLQLHGLLRRQRDDGRAVRKNTVLRAVEVHDVQPRGAEVAISQQQLVRLVVVTRLGAEVTLKKAYTAPVTQVDRGNQ